MTVSISKFLVAASLALICSATWSVEVTTRADDALAAASVYQIVAPGRNPYQPRRTMELFEGAQALSQRSRGYLQQLPPAETWGGRQDDFSSKMDGLLTTFVPMAIAARDDGSSPVELVMKAAEQDVLQQIMAGVAFQAVMGDLVKRVIPQHLATIDGIPDGPIQVINAVGGWGLRAIHQEAKTRNLIIVPDRLGETGMAIASVMKPLAEKRAVDEVVTLRVLPRIDQAGSLASAESIERAKEHVRSRAVQMVEAPFTPARIDGWCQSLTAEAKQILAGVDMTRQKPGSPSTPAARSDGRPEAPRKPLIMGRSIAVVAGPTVGSLISKRPGRKITIPQGSHGDAYLLTGVECEIGGKQGTPVMLNLARDFRGPNGSHVPLPNLRLIGQASSMAGAERVSVTLNSLSYVFPSGKTINLGISGYVVDVEEGREGMIGTFNWNVTKIVPWAVTAGGLEGFADALTANSAVAVPYSVNTGTGGIGGVGATTNVIAQTGDKLQNAAYAGLGSGAGIMADYVKRVLDEIKPTVSVRNGQRVTIVLTQPLTVEGTEDDWDGLIDFDQVGP